MIAYNKNYRKINKVLIFIFVCLLSLMLVSCVEDDIIDENEQYKIEMPKDLCVGERYELRFKDGINKEEYDFNILTSDEVGFKDYVLFGKEEGTASIEIVYPNGNKDYVMFEILPEVPVERIEFSIDKGDDENYVVEKEYKMNCVAYPERSRQEFTFSVGDTKNVVDTDKMTIKFGVAGELDIICYAKRNKDAKQILKVDVGFNKDIEMYQVLYIGNSLTNYTYNIPSIISKLMKSVNIPYNYTIDAPSGFWIADHADDYYNYVDKNRYTHIVYQEQSKGPITDYDKFESTILDFTSYVKYEDTKFVVYETWAYERSYLKGEENQREMTMQLKEAYEKVAKLIGADIVRSGEAFWEYEQRSYVNGEETLPTLFADANHPSFYGAFLSACVHYVTLTGRSAVDNEYMPTEIEAEVALLIKQIADDIALNKTE